MFSALYHTYTWIIDLGPLSNVLCVFICEFTISKIAFSASALAPHCFAISEPLKRELLLG